MGFAPSQQADTFNKVDSDTPTTHGTIAYPTFFLWTGCGSHKSIAIGRNWSVFEVIQIQSMVLIADLPPFFVIACLHTITTERTDVSFMSSRLSRLITNSMKVNIE